MTTPRMPVESTPADTNAVPAQTDTAVGPPMLEMREGLLDVAQVEQLFSDLDSCTRILAILEKGGQQAHAKSNNSNLEAARDRFLNREVLAVQIRYHYDNAEWIDTILHTTAGIRVVRCQQHGP